MMNSQILRWLVSPFIVLFAFFASALIFVLLAKFLGVWDELFAGFFAAFTVVIVGYWASPNSKNYGGQNNYRMAAAIVWFLVGASISWFMLRDAVYPESHARAYMPTYLPLLSTYTGGLIAIGLCWVHFYKRKN